MRSGRPPLKLDFNFILERCETAPNGCWNWKKMIRKDGYGKTASCNKQYLAHRLSYCLSTGMDMQSELLVLHKCANKKCVNPEHLYAGTQYENVWDYKRLGVKPYYDRQGKKNPNVKLSASSVKAVEKRLKNGEKVINIAKEFGVSVKPIYAIKNKKHWSANEIK